MSIVRPYRNLQQSTRLPIEAYHLNNEILIHMKNNLKKYREKKCNKNGYIDEIYRIIEYSDGKLISENLNGSVMYEVSFHCRICIPVENTILIAQVKIINQELVICINGPIIIYIPKENVDTNIWDIYDGYMNKNTKNKLIATNLVKVLIVDKRINNNDVKINAMGKLLDFPTPEEVEKYYNVINKNVNEEESLEQKSNYI